MTAQSRRQSSLTLPPREGDVARLRTPTACPLGDYVYMLRSGDTLTVRFGAGAGCPRPQLCRSPPSRWWPWQGLAPPVGLTQDL
jgi:hypothetical protein